jgi:H+/gluconate symporter-like permease
MANQIILNEPLQMTAANVTFTAAEWSAMSAQINNDMYTMLWVGLMIGVIIGIIAGIGGLYFGTKFYGKNRK